MSLPQNCVYHTRPTNPASDLLLVVCLNMQVLLIKILLFSSHRRIHLFQSNNFFQVIELWTDQSFESFLLKTCIDPMRKSLLVEYLRWNFLKKISLTSLVLQYKIQKNTLSQASLVRLILIETKEF